MLAVVGVCLVLTGCTVTATGRPTAAADLGHWQPPLIPTTRLGDLLLSANEINAIAGSATLAVRRPISRMWNDDDVITDVDCLDAYSPIEKDVYDGSNWNAVNGQILDDAGPLGDPPAEHGVVQAVVGFRDADSAKEFFTQAKQHWSQCANRSITVARPGHKPVTWAFEDAVSTETTITMMQTDEGSDGWACQRAMGLRNNVIIDTLWCGFGTVDQGGTVVSKIADEVAQA